MARKRVKGIKYGKVSKQQKYMLLHACLVEQKSIHEAAFEVGVHYSTAKTILFFHKKQNKAYTNFTLNNAQEPQGQSNIPRATYMPVAINIECEKMILPTIELVSTVGASHQKRKREKCSSRQSTDQVKIEEVEEENMSEFKNKLYKVQESMNHGKNWRNCMSEERNDRNPQFQCEFKCFVS